MSARIDTDHLLFCLSEECDEVGQRVMKALRFGLEEVQPKQALNNAQRIVAELNDLIAAALILQERGVLDGVIPTIETVMAKELRIAKYTVISKTHSRKDPSS